MFTEKTHDTLRKIQRIAQAASLALIALTATVNLGVLGIWASALISAVAVFCGELSEDDSKKWRNNVIITPSASCELVTIDEKEAEG